MNLGRIDDANTVAPFDQKLGQREAVGAGGL